jgi:hypothetical protein
MERWVFFDRLLDQILGRDDRIIIAVHFRDLLPLIFRRRGYVRVTACSVARAGIFQVVVKRVESGFSQNFGGHPIPKQDQFYHR